MLVVIESIDTDSAQEFEANLDTFRETTPQSSMTDCQQLYLPSCGKYNFHPGYTAFMSPIRNVQGSSFGGAMCNRLVSSAELDPLGVT